MKKNRMMRVAVMLLALTLMTSCFVGGTFAKYVTAGNTGEQTARVAKWGVTVTGTGDLFAKEYNETGSVTVSSSEYVVAPGTNGALAKFTISGEPEVTVTVDYTATVTVSGWAVTGDDFYCPLKVTVGATVIDGLTFDNAADFASAIKAAIEGTHASYAVGEPISDVLNVSWVWEFEGDNAKDTLLGNSAESHTIVIDITCTITQVD